MSVYHLNVQSIRYKTLEIEHFLARNNTKFDILCFTEHHLKIEEMCGLHLDGFNNVSSFCRQSHPSGGAIVFVNKNIQAVSRDDLVQLSVELDIEIAAVEIKSLRLIIISIYRRPKGDINIFLETLDKLLSMIDFLDNHVIVNGDFNVLFNSNDKNSREVLNMFRTFGFTKTIVDATRKNNCIDNVFVNVSENFNSYVLDPSLSDHSGVAIDLNINTQILKHNKVTLYRPITQMGLFNLYHRLENEDWSFICNVRSDLNIKFELFINKIVAHIEVAFPLKSKNKSPKHVIKWFNEDLKSDRETLSFLANLKNKYPTIEYFKHSYFVFRKFYRNKLEIAKNEANANFIKKSENKAKAAWNIINAKRKNIQELNEVDIKANDFNSFFVTVAKDLLDKLPVITDNNPATSVLSVNSSFSFSNVSVNQVRNAINALKPKNSQDIYGISAKIIKNVKDPIVVSLTKLFNDCIDKGVFPTSLKVAKVMPVFKKGNVNDTANYRPISLVPIFSKILELLLKQQICDYLDVNAVLNTAQFGFRKGMSTSQAIAALANFVTDGFENKTYIGATFCDLSRAFDCVDCPVLIKKLKCYGFRENSLKLMESFLLGRKQTTCFNNKMSTMLNVDCGVPQGSVLGPLLFIIYINDLPGRIPGTDIVLFADDTTILCSSTDCDNVKVKMTDAQSRAKLWFNTNKLTLNETKTEQMIFSLRDRSEINNPQWVKFLGVYIDPILKWNFHIDHVGEKLTKTVYLIRNLKPSVSLDMLTLVYYALFQSNFAYAITVWGHSCHTKELFKIQRKAIRVMMGLGFRDDVKNAFIKLGILTVPSYYILACLLYMKNYLHKYDTVGSGHNYHTRYENNINIKFKRLETSRNCFHYYGPLFYNKLTPHLKSLPFKTFKHKIKTFLQNNAFYEIEEFLNVKL